MMKQETLKLEDEEKCVLPLEPNAQQLLQPAEELILPDLLMASSSSQNDSKMPSIKHLSSRNCSRSVRCMDVTNQESRSEPTAAKTRSRRSIVNSEMPDNPIPAVCHQVFDGGRKLFNNSSTFNNLESLSVDLNIEINRHECSVGPGLVCFDSKKSYDNLKLQRDSTNSFERTHRVPSVYNNLNYDSGETNTAMESDSISKEVTVENTFATDNREEVQTSFSVNPDSKNLTKKINHVYNFSCKMCNRNFNRKAQLRVHEESRCGSIKLFGCNICTKGFKTKRYLQSHMHSHRSGETSTFNCGLCNKVYKSKKLLVKHENTHDVSNNVGTPPQTCEYCQKLYSSREQLLVHVKRMHVSPELFECAHCSKIFKHRVGIILHMQLYHIPGRKRCNLCKRFFSSEDDLQIHLKNDNCTGKKFICDQCGKTFIVKLKLSNHLLIHTDEKPFMCQTCGKCFKTESNLSQHSVTHSDIRPFSCDVCSKNFRIRNHLRQHMVVHGLVNSAAKQRYRNKKA